VFFNIQYRFNVNAYQQQYPPFPELIQTKKAASHTQCQTDPLTFASLSDNTETRMKLHAALEELGDDTDFESEMNAAEMLAAEQRNIALKKFEEKESARLEGLKPALLPQSRPLHLPHRHVHREQQSNLVENPAPDTTQNIKDYVVQRDSVLRLREMLEKSHRGYGLPQLQPLGSQSNDSSALSSARKLPKRVYDAVREPPKIIPQKSESLISLAEKLRSLDVSKTEWGSEYASLYFENEPASSVLQQKLEQLPLSAHTGRLQASAIGTTYSLSYSLQSRQRNSGDL
jgi:hypothetical protein